MDTQTEKTSASGQARAMLAFAEHLRDRPDAAQDSEQALAARFGLPEEIVREAVEVARKARRPVAPFERAAAPSLLRDRLGGIARAMVDHPLHATGVICAPGALLGTLNIWARSPAVSAVAIAVWVLALPTLLILNFSRGQVRFALASSLIAGAMLPIPLAVKTAIGAEAVEALGWQKYCIAGILSAVLLSMFAVAAATVGGYMRMHREVREEERLGRLSILERVLDLQGRLADDGRTQDPVPTRDWLRPAKRYWVAFSACVGAVTALLSWAIKAAVGMPEPGASQTTILAQIVLWLVPLLLVLVLTFMAGFLAGDWRRGLAAGFLVTAAMHAMSILGLDGEGWAAVVEQYRANPDIGLLQLMYPMLGMLGGFAAAVEARASTLRRLQAADRVALLGEIVRLQQVLNTGAAEVCVLVVDCVKSTSMKQGADPFKVEASFRAFHDRIDAICRRHAGSIISVAGDGAVAEFVGAHEALACAREIQARMPEFNTRGNRLASPFHVRVGLHCGLVQGGLDQVVFNQVIDIAAHIERAAPAGGIAVSEEVRARAPEVGYAELAARIDGHAVHIVLNPVG